jgi:hypothetical protein
MDYPQEMIKRKYAKAEYKTKIRRLWKYYGKTIHRPKIVIKEYDKVLRRYFRYKSKKLMQKSYLFSGKEDPMVKSR